MKPEKPMDESGLAPPESPEHPAVEMRRETLEIEGGRKLYNYTFRAAQDLGSGPEPSSRDCGAKPKAQG